MPPTPLAGHALRKIAAPLVLAALAASAVASPAAAYAAPTPTSSASAPAPKGVQLQTTLRQLLARAQKIAAARDGVVTRADLEAALSFLGLRAWEQGVTFQLTDTYSAGTGDISVFFAADGTLGVAVGGTDTCALTTLAPGATKPTTWSFDTALGKNCSGRTAAAGPTTQAPPYLDPIPPAALSGVSVTGLESSLAVSWPASTAADLDHYTVYVNGTKAGTTTDTHFVVTGLADYTTYTVTVTAVDTADNESKPAAPVSGTPVDLTAPDAPTGLTAAAGDGQIALTWDPSPAVDLDHYVVYADGAEIATTTDPTYTATGLVDYVDHSYQVVAVDTHHNSSGLSDALTAHAVDLTAPDIPTGLTATAGDGQVTLAWDPSPAADLGHYVVYADGVKLAETTTPGYTVTGLENYVAHSYQIAAVDGHGNASKAGDPATATPIDLTAPDAPTGLAGKPGDGQVTLTWDASSATDLDHYNVYVDGVKVAEAHDPAQLADCLVNYVDHDFTVTAVDIHGNESPASAPLTTASVDLTAPDAPTGLTATAGTGQVTLTWDASTAADVDHYTITDGTGTVLATIAAGTTTATLDGLTAGTDYSFAVLAVDGHDNASAPTPVVTVTVPAAAAAVAVNEDVWSPVKGDRYGTPLGGAEVDRVSGSGVLNHASASASRDGRYVVFGTAAQLEPTDTNVVYELYLQDRQTDTVRRLFPVDDTKIDKNYPEPASDLLNYAWTRISGNGRYLLVATNQAKVPGDTNYANDLYRYDLTTGEWALATAPASGLTGTQAGLPFAAATSGVETAPGGSITADGRYVFFSATRTGLVTSGSGNLYRKDMTTGEVKVVTSVRGSLPVATPDGKWLFFQDDTYGTLYRTEVATGATTRVIVRYGTTGMSTVAPASSFGNEGDPEVSVSDDGRYAMVSTTNTLTADGNPYRGRAYRIDVDAGTALSVNPALVTSTASYSADTNVLLDPTGRYGYFSSTLNESPGTPRPSLNGFYSAYRTDFETGEVTMVSTDGQGRYTTGSFPVLTNQEFETYVTALLDGDNALVETAQPLVSSDYNGTTDLFVKDTGTGFVTSVAPGQTYDLSNVAKEILPDNYLDQAAPTPDGGAVSVVRLNKRGKRAHTIFAHRILSDRFPDVDPAYSTLVVKTDAAGDVQWLAPTTATLVEVAVLPDGDVLVPSGVANTQPTVTRYDGNTGAVQWVSQIAAGEAVSLDRVVYDAASDRVYALGGTYTRTSDLTGPATYQIGTSTIQRGTTVAYPAISDAVLAVRMDPATGTLLSGHKLATISQGGLPAVTRAAVSPAGDLYVAFKCGPYSGTEQLSIADGGPTYTSTDTSRDAYVVKVDGDLTRVLGHARIDAATTAKEATIRGLAFAADGTLLVTGDGTGTTRIGAATVTTTGPLTGATSSAFLARLNTDTMTWGPVVSASALYDSTTGKAGSVHFAQIDRLPGGHFVIGYSSDYGFTLATPGATTRTLRMTSVATDVGLLEYDPATGTIVAGTRYGTFNNETLTSSAVNPDGTVRIGGVLSSYLTGQYRTWTYSADKPAITVPREQVYAGVSGYVITLPSPAAENDSRFRLF